MGTDYMYNPFIASGTIPVTDYDAYMYLQGYLGWEVTSHLNYYLHYHSV